MVQLWRLWSKLKVCKARGRLAGKICAVIDLVTRLPVEFGFTFQPLQRSETNFEASLIEFTAKL